MTFLAPKVVLTPLLIASASLAGRRWGAITSGWLLALPLTSGPIALFIALDLGPAAAAQVAAGALVGATAQVTFALIYARVSQEYGWRSSLVTASLTFAVAVTVIPAAPPALLAVIAIGAAVGALVAPALRSGPPDAAITGLKPGRWDIPARAAVATILVVAIGAAAPIVGGHVAGILATFPVYISVLTTFAHRLGGAAQARGVLRGLILGLPGFTLFFLAVASLVEPLGVLPAFAIALVTALGLNGLILVLTVRR